MNDGLADVWETAALVLVTLAVMAGPAVADGRAIEALQTLGLFGMWSPDCKLPASRDNPRVTWTLVGEEIVHRVSFDGRGTALMDMVGTAEMLSDEILRVTSVRRGRVALTSTLVVRDGTVRAMRSVGADGRVYYDHGVEQATGKPSLVSERCAAAMS